MFGREAYQVTSVTTVSAKGWFHHITLAVVISSLQGSLISTFFMLIVHSVVIYGVSVCDTHLSIISNIWINSGHHFVSFVRLEVFSTSLPVQRLGQVYEAELF